MLVNPVGFRLSTSIFWKFTWSLYKYDSYKYLFYSDLIFFQYFLFFFRKLLKSKKTDYYISHLRLYRIKKNIIINLFYYNPSEEIIYKYFKDHFFKRKKKKIIWKKKRSLKYWKKRKKRILLKIFNIKRKKYKVINKKYCEKKKIIKIKKKEFKTIFRYKNSFGKKIFYKLDENNKYKKLEKKNNKIYETQYWRYKKKIKNFLWKQKKNREKKLWKQKTNNKRKIKSKTKKFKYIKIKNLKIKKLIKLKKIYKKKKNKFKYNKNFSFLLKIFFKKFLFNFKYIIYNIYIYILSKIIKKEFKKIFLKKYKSFKINFYMISLKQITARIIGKYIRTKLQKRYNIWKALGPVLIDLNKRILLKQIKGYKITVTGRFKRALRATYLWRKRGGSSIGTITVPIDYEVLLNRTKYGICAIKIWITGGIKMFDYYQKNFPLFKIIFFFEKNNIFYLQKNQLFFNLFLTKFYMAYSNFNNKYIKKIIINIIYKYLYINIFLKKLYLKKKKIKKKKNKIMKFILLPQYCLYKIYILNFLKSNVIKIKPYINFIYLKRINVRRAYNLSYFSKKIKTNNKKQIKYKIKIK